MKQETKLLGAIGIMPVLADFLEDQPFNQTMKMKANHLISAIRSFDRFMMDDTDVELHEQQINIQLAFRQWLQKLEDEK